MGRMDAAVGSGAVLALAVLATACGSGTAVIAGSGGDSSSTTTEVVPTDLSVQTPVDGQAGNVALAYQVQLDPNHRVRLEAVEFSLRGNVETEFAAATPARGFPTDLVVDPAAPDERNEIGGDELGARPDPLLRFVWNARFDLDALLRAGLINRPVTARAVLRVTLRDLANGSRLRATTDEFFLDLGRVSSFAGGGVGDGDNPKSASMLAPSDAAIGPLGVLYVSDTDNHRIRTVDLEGGTARRIRTVAGNGFRGVLPGVNPARATSLDSPRSIAVSGAGDVFLAEDDELGGSVLRFLEGSSGLLGTLCNGCFVGIGGIALQGTDLLVSESGMGRVWRFSIDGIDLLHVGLPSTPRFAKGFFKPTALAAVADRAFVVDEAMHRVHELGQIGGRHPVVAGGGVLDPATQLGAILSTPTLATDVFLHDPAGLEVSKNFLFISDQAAGLVLVVETAGFTVVNAVSEVAVPGNPPSARPLERPSGLALDGDGRLFIVESGDGLVQVGSKGHQVVVVEQPELPGSVAVALAASDAEKVLAQAVGGATTPVSGVFVIKDQSATG